jgi:hypothetical protein
MANDCWNKAIIQGDEATLKKIQERFNSSENGVFNTFNYKILFDSDVSDMEEDDWGSKRFFPSTDLSDGQLFITGDSAWSPMIGLFETICAEYGVECVLEYDESGYDFAGIISWDTKGAIKDHIEMTYWEKLHKDSLNDFYEELGYRAEIYDSYEEYLEDLDLNKWRDSSKVDMDKLKEIWNLTHNES